MAQKLPIDLLSGLYKPEYEPIVETLNKAEFDAAAIAAAVEKEIENRINTATEEATKGSQSKISQRKKLSSLESEILDRQIETLNDQLTHTRNRISAFKDYISDQVRADASGELSFSLDIKKKSHLRKAVIDVFGKKTSTITYSMYLEAKAAKKLIEETQSQDYLKADWSK